MVDLQFALVDGRLQASYRTPSGNGIPEGRIHMLNSGFSDSEQDNEWHPGLNDYGATLSEGRDGTLVFDVAPSYFEEAREEISYVISRFGLIPV